MPELHRILCCDDEPDIRTILQIALETVGGFAVTLCASGRDLLERAPDAAPDLIILDVMMPGLDGPQTLEALRRLPGFAETPVIFMTAKAQPAELDRFRSHGAVEVLTKPFDPMTLAGEIRRVWTRLAG